MASWIPRRRQCPRQDDPAQRTLKNPLGEEYSLMRGTLLRDLRDAAALNLDRGAREVRLFEIAPVFIAQPQDPATRSRSAGPWPWSGPARPGARIP